MWNAGNDNGGTLIIDANCSPQNIAFPQNVNLLNEARENLEEIIGHHILCVQPQKAKDVQGKSHKGLS